MIHNQRDWKSSLVFLHLINECNRCWNDTDNPQVIPGPDLNYRFRRLDILGMKIDSSNLFFPSSSDPFVYAAAWVTKTFTSGRQMHERKTFLSVWGLIITSKLFTSFQRKWSSRFSNEMRCDAKSNKVFLFIERRFLRVESAGSRTPLGKILSLKIS